MAKGRASKIGVWIILGLLFVGLAGFSVTNFGGRIESIGRVGNTEIGTQRYFREMQNELAALRQQLGRDVSFAEAQGFGLDRAVLGRVVGEVALENETAELGISVGDEEVRKQVLQIAAFQGIDGQFDREAYSFALQNAGLTVAEFEERVRAETARRLLTAGIIAGARAQDGYVDTLYNWARETRDITWARLGADDLAEPLPEPSENALQDYHALNIEDFTLPEERAITYAWLTPEMIVDSVPTDEATLRGIYEARIDDYVQPERRLVERLVYGNEADAQAARDRLDAGEATFDDLIADRGLEPEDADLGDVTEADLGDAGAAVFALTEPGVVGPVNSPLGPALFRMNAILAAQETSFEEARSDLAAEYATDEARRIILDEMGAIDDLLAGGATLEELAGETDMQLGQIDWRPDITDDIAAFEAFRAAAAIAQPDDFPELIEFEEGGIFALRLDALRPPREQPLSEVREAVIAGWEAEETTRRLASQALGLAESIRAGREMAALRVDLNTDRDLARDAFIEDAPPGMIAGIFEMSRDDIRVFEDSGAAVLVRLDAINTPDPEAVESVIVKQAFRQQTQQTLATDMVEFFTRAAQSAAGISIDSAAINAVNTQHR